MSSRYATDITRHRFPGIARAALEMAYCNGGVNRERPERVVINALDRLLGDGADLAFDLPAISEWLTALPEDDLQVVVDGEVSEQEQMLAAAPPGTDALLNAIFERGS